MNRYISILINSLLVLLLASKGLDAQEQYYSSVFDDTIEFCHDLFEKDKPIELIIEFDIKNFQKTRENEEYHPAKLSWLINDTLQKEYSVKLKTRGIFRKKFCHLPPFWMNIKKSDIDFIPGKEIGKMKVVTHCNRYKDYNDYVLKEYLTYKIYNQISPNSFRVRLVKMTYIDIGRENKETQKWAFLIEPNSHLENRLDGIMLESEEFSMKQMNAREMDKLAHFQYMIGNGDYSIAGMHNIKVIQLNNNTPSGKIPIPYDFDFTGVVNTSYAKPRESLGIENVKVRYFLGPCRSDNMHQLAIDNLIKQKHDIEEIIESFEYLSINHKIEMLKYIESYYTSITNKYFIDRNIHRTCR